MRYPFSPDILDAIPEELAELFRTLELTLLEEISKRLMAADQLNEVTVQNIRVLRSHGISTEEIKKAIREATGISQKKLDSLLEDVVERNQRYYEDLIDLAKVTEPETLVSKRDIDLIIKQTKDELENITRTMGFVVDSGRTMIEPTQAYKWALDNAAMQIQSGGVSYNQAIANATKQLADSGLEVISYESGHRDQVDVAVRRAVMTGVNQLNSQYADESMDYLETEYVEVSAHSGARDKDGPLGWENHKKWQGKVYWWSEKSHGEPEYQYPDFVKTCGLGSVTGILGANCRHNYSPFIPDVMERTYTDAELAKIDPPDFEYEGKRYTHYEATQQQRAIERAVRKWKRREAAATNPEDKQAAQIRQRLLKQKYEEFSKAANLRTQPERMKAYVPKKAEKIIKPDQPVKAAKPVVVTNTPKEVQNPVYGHKEVTQEWYANQQPKTPAKELKEFEQDGVRYRVDGKNVKLEVGEDERKAAALLEKEFGGELFFVPKVQGHNSRIQTPDLLFRGKRFDLKTPEKINPKHKTFFNMVHSKREQADNFIFDISRNGMTEEAALEEIEKLYEDKYAAFVNTIILIKSGRILHVFRRNK